MYHAEKGSFSVPDAAAAVLSAVFSRCAFDRMLHHFFVPSSVVQTTRYILASGFDVAIFLHASFLSAAATFAVKSSY